MSRVNTDAERPYSVSLARRDRIGLVARADDRRRPGRSSRRERGFMSGVTPVDHGARASARCRGLAARRAARRPCASASSIRRVAHGRPSSGRPPRPAASCPRADRRPASTGSLGGELRGERVGDGFDHDDPLGRHADLALVHEGAERRGLDRLVEIGILEHDQSAPCRPARAAPASGARPRAWR